MAKGLTRVAQICHGLKVRSNGEQAHFIPARDEEADKLVVREMERKGWRYDGKSEDGTMLKFWKRIGSKEDVQHDSI